MKNNLKRYGIALLFLFLVVFMMLLGTMGVKSFGDKMFQEANITIKPEGERIEL